MLEYAGHPTFSCSHEPELFDFLVSERQTHDGRNYDGVGVVEVKLGGLKAALGHRQINLGEGTREAIEEDIKWANARGQDYIIYDCF